MRPPPTFEYLKRLYLSVSGMDIDALQDYIDSRPDLDHQDESPETLRLCGGMTLLHYAAAAGDTRTIGLLMSAGANPNLPRHDGWTPLHHAIDFDFVVATQQGHYPTSLPTVEMLLRGGADDSIRNRDGETPLDLVRHVPEVVAVYTSLRESIPVRLHRP